MLYVFRSSGVLPLVGAGLLVLASLPLSGCANKSQHAGNPMSASPMQLAALDKAYRSNPSDARAGISYASALAAAGEAERSLTVLGELAKRNPQDPQIQGNYGKALARAGKSNEAITVLTAPALRGSQDPSVFSALGTAYDRHGEFGAAQAAYARALQLNPGDMAALNNSAMSHMLEGNPAQAEVLLRQAMTGPGSQDPRIRQNLALAIGLQGRFEEARNMASADLPREDVEANLAYLEQMLSQQDTWRKLKTNG